MYLIFRFPIQNIIKRSKESIATLSSENIQRISCHCYYHNTYSLCNWKYNATI